MQLFLISLLAILPMLLLADSAHDIKIMKLQIKALIKLQSDTNQKLTQTNKRFAQEMANVRQESNQNFTRENQEISNKLTQTNQKLSKNSQSLSQKLTQTSQVLSQRITQTSQEVQVLKTKDQTLNGYCKTKANACGSCYCVEDFNIPDKYFCDCRGKPTRRDCKEHFIQGERINGLYRINLNTYGMMVPVYCDQTTDGGGWTLLQRRVDGSTNFFRNWQTYKRGFGQLQHEHWLGNDNLHLLTAQSVLTGSEMRIELQVKDSNSMNYAKYSSFHIDGESNAYQLHISGFSGNLGDWMAYIDGTKWTTSDRKNDVWASGGKCAYHAQGAWWYKGCHHLSNLNAAYERFKQHSTGETFYWKPYRLQLSEMKVRRK